MAAKPYGVGYRVLGAGLSEVDFGGPGGTWSSLKSSCVVVSQYQFDKGVTRKLRIIE